MTKIDRLFAILYVFGFAVLTVWVPVFEYDILLPTPPAGSRIVDPTDGPRAAKTNALILLIGHEGNGFNLAIDPPRYWERQGILLLLVGGTYLFVRWRRSLRDAIDFIWFYMSRSTLIMGKFIALNRKQLLVQIYLLASIAILLHIPCKWKLPLFGRVYLNRGPYVWESGYRWLWQLKDVEVRYSILLIEEGIALLVAIMIYTILFGFGEKLDAFAAPASKSIDPPKNPYANH